MVRPLTRQDYGGDILQSGGHIEFTAAHLSELLHDLLSILAGHLSCRIGQGLDALLQSRLLTVAVPILLSGNIQELITEFIQHGIQFLITGKV